MLSTRKAQEVEFGGQALSDGRTQVIRNAKLWCDVESAPEAQSLSKKWNWTLVPGFTASKILWLKENEPENWAKLANVALPHDYFNYYLTGRLCMEVRSIIWMASSPSELGLAAAKAVHS